MHHPNFMNIDNKQYLYFFMNFKPVQRCDENHNSQLGLKKIIKFFFLIFHNLYFIMVFGEINPHDLYNLIFGFISVKNKEMQFKTFLKFFLLQPQGLLCQMYLNPNS